MTIYKESNDGRIFGVCGAMTDLVIEKSSVKQNGYQERKSAKNDKVQ